MRRRANMNAALRQVLACHAQNLPSVEKEEPQDRQSSSCPCAKPGDGYGTGNESPLTRFLGHTQIPTKSLPMSSRLSVARTISIVPEPTVDAVLAVDPCGLHAISSQTPQQILPVAFLRESSKR
jgi:hypothetical protein